VLDNQHVIHSALILDGQVQMHCDFRAISMIDQSIVAHCGHKWNTIPVPKHTIANIVHMFVAYFVEVIRLSAHVKSVVVDAPSSLHKQSQKK
jgi:hypothetical protein